MNIGAPWPDLDEAEQPPRHRHHARGPTSGQLLLLFNPLRLRSCPNLGSATSASLVGDGV